MSTCYFAYNMKQRPVIVLTGGPGGGKSTLIEELRHDPTWAGRFVALLETIHYAGFVNSSPREKLFQRVMVNLQMALEDGLKHALDVTDSRPIICHRGSLVPLAYWIQRGWAEGEFLEFPETRLEDHYQRYTAVIQLVTAADGASWAYSRWPHAHRPEEAEDAIRLDRCLAQVWGKHPQYFRLDNTGRTWQEKSAEARRILRTIVGP